MCRRIVLVLGLLLHVCIGLWANPANGDPRLEKLFSMFIAPCCWRENLLAHQSPKADELRAAIRRQVAEGKSDEDIRSALAAEYSKRILAMPEGAPGLWLSWMPVLATAAGLGMVTLFIKRRLATPAGIPQNTETKWRTNQS